MRGKITIFIDGNNLFHAARSVGVEIDYAKFLNFLRESYWYRFFIVQKYSKKFRSIRGSCYLFVCDIDRVAS